MTQRIELVDLTQRLEELQLPSIFVMDAKTVDSVGFLEGVPK